MTYWTPDEDAELTKLAADGRTRAEIAALIGRTYDGVKNHVKRLGLAVEGAVTTRTRNDGPPHQAAEPIDRSFAFRPLANVTPVGLESLRGFYCRWPIDYDSAGIAFERMHYCGAPVVCAPYCATHHALGRVPARPRSSPVERELIK